MRGSCREVRSSKSAEFNTGVARWKSWSSSETEWPESACVEQILKHDHNFDITIFGDETHVNYNRILLSSVLAGEKAAGRHRFERSRLVPAERYRSAARRPHH